MKRHLMRINVHDHLAAVRSSLIPTVIRYASALSIVLVAIVIRLWFHEILDRAGFAIFLTAMLAAAWVGGLGPCLIAQTLILFAEAYWFSPTHQVHSPWTAQGIVSLVAFFSVGGIVAILSEAWQAARQRAIAQRNEAIAQREQLHATITCVGDGVISTDARGHITLMNPIAEGMTGWSADESIERPIRDIFAIYDERSPDRLEDPVQEVLRDGDVLHGRMRLFITTRNDRRLPVSYSAAPVRDADGRTTGAVLILRDETERRRTETALRDADRRKDEFLATLAHELRNPLAPICMGLELIKMDDGNRSPSEEVVGMMERQTRQMVRLIDDLLDVSRITRGKLELRKSSVELAAIVRDAVEATRPAIEEGKHQLTIRLPDERIVLFADPNRLTQVFSNLIANAAKFTPPCGAIELAVEPSDGDVLIAVSDTGIGIPSDMLDHVFDMFTQVRGETDSGQSGLGIGLTLVKQLVEMHGGIVNVDSKGHNLGSRFEVRLPVVEPTVGQPTLNGKPQTQPAEMKRRVLVVDDNVDGLKTLSMLVKLLGNEVREASDGCQAIEIAEQFEPEVILMDLGMPKLNGFDAARRIRQESWGQGIVLVATTGWGQDDDRRRSKEAGFDHHLVKPVEIARLQELLAATEVPKLAGKYVAPRDAVAANGTAAYRPKRTSARRSGENGQTGKDPEMTGVTNHDASTRSIP